MGKSLGQQGLWSKQQLSGGWSANLHGWQGVILSGDRWLRPGQWLLFQFSQGLLTRSCTFQIDHGEVDSTNSLCLKKTKNNVIKFLFLKTKRDRISNWKKILPPGMPLLERHIGSWKYFRTIDGQGTCIWGCLKVTFLCRITVSVGILSKNTY